MESPSPWGSRHGPYWLRLTLAEDLTAPCQLRQEGVGSQPPKPHPSASANPATPRTFSSPRRSQLRKKRFRRGGQLRGPREAGPLHRTRTRCAMKPTRLTTLCLLRWRTGNRILAYPFASSSILYFGSLTHSK